MSWAVFMALQRAVFSAAEQLTSIEQWQKAKAAAWTKLVFSLPFLESRNVAVPSSPDN